MKEIAGNLRRDVKDLLGESANIVTGIFKDGLCTVRGAANRWRNFTRDISGAFVSLFKSTNEALLPDLSPEQQPIVTVMESADEHLPVGARMTLDQHGRHEMSNMVYCFSWREYERTEWSRAEQKSVVVAWDLSWSLYFNTTQNPDYSGSGRRLAGQDRKVFKDRAAMEKYLQGRIAAYSHLFTEISPPIPEDARKRFCVNGILLPGYTVETPVPDLPDEKNVEDLLSLLEDGDMDALPQPEEPAPPPAPPPRRQAPQKNRPQRSDPVR